MCYPVTASIVATVAGSAAQAAGQARSRRAMEGAQQAELTRQKAFQGQSDAAFSESLSHADPQAQEGAKAKAEGERNAAYEKANAQARAPLEATGKNLAGNESANRVLNTESAARTAQAQGYAGQQGAAKAALRGFNDNQLGNALYNARQMQNQGTIGNFMQGSAAVLPYEVSAASHKGDSLKSIGDLLSAAGAIGGIGAGAGWWGGADAAAGAGALGSAGSEASNLAMGLGTNTDLALGRSALGSGLSSEYANMFNFTPNSSFFPVGSVTSQIPLNSLASYGKYAPGLIQ